ncbi:MAG: GDSL-type esterase/lipase family protein [Patescibacteria group bacterium]|mgnify:CR=1 FL=1
MDKLLLVFGTSTTYGAWDSEGGWVTRLRKFIDNKIINSGYKLHHLVYNLGISGDKTEDVVKRFDTEASARSSEKRETVILFHLGANDTIFNESLGVTEVSPDQFKENFKILIDKARKYSDTIILVSFMPVDKRVDPMPWAPGRSYRNEYLETYDQVLAKVAEDKNVHFIEVFKKYINSDYSSLLADGVHMNDDGHKKLYETVRDYLIKNKIIDSD